MTIAVALIATGMPGSAAADLSSCVAGLRNAVVGAGIDRGLAARALGDVAFDEKAVRFSRTQPEYRTPIWDYMAFLVDRERIVTGQAMLMELASTLAAVEKA